MKRILQISAAALILSAAAACTQQDAAEPTDTATEDMAATPDTPGTIVEVAQGDPQFSTLVSALTEADLATTLSGTGPYTVFAPTNSAFEKLDSATLGSLMEPANKEQLSGILTYHVIPGNVNAAALTQMITDGNGTAELTTVNGAKLMAKMDGTNVVLTDPEGNNATVTAADVPASNGTIHVIDTVLMPS